MTKVPTRKTRRRIFCQVVLYNLSYALMRYDYFLTIFSFFQYFLELCVAGLVNSADLLTPSEPDAGSSAPDGNI